MIDDVERHQQARDAMRGLPITPTSPLIGTPGWIVVVLMGILLATCVGGHAHSADQPTPAPQASLMIYGGSIKPVVKVQSDGNLYWNGRLVTTDAQFKAAVLEALRGQRCSQ